VSNIVFVSYPSAEFTKIKIVLTLHLSIVTSKFRIVSLFSRVCISLEECQLIPSRMSTCPAVRLSAFIKSVATGCIFANFDIGNFYENLSRKSTFAENRTNIWGTFQYIVLVKAEQNIPKLDKTAKGRRYLLFTAKLKVFYFFSDPNVVQQ
jgi:hypothetical protein